MKILENLRNFGALLWLKAMSLLSVVDATPVTRAATAAVIASMAQLVTGHVVDSTFVENVLILAGACAWGHASNQNG